MWRRKLLNLFVKVTVIATLAHYLHFYIKRLNKMEQNLST